MIRAYNEMWIYQEAWDTSQKWKPEEPDDISYQEFLGYNIIYKNRTNIFLSNVQFIV